MNTNVKYRVVGLIGFVLNNTLFPVIKITGNKIKVEYTLPEYTMLMGSSPYFTNL